MRSPAVRLIGALSKLLQQESVETMLRPSSTIFDPSVASATSPESAKRLWELSEDLTVVRYHLPVTA